MEGLDLPFVFPGAQDNPLSPVTACGIGPVPVLNCLENPSDHGLFLVGHIEVNSLVQDAWWVQGGPIWDGQLLAHGHEDACHGNPLLHQFQVGVHGVSQPLARVILADKQDLLQILGLPA